MTKPAPSQPNLADTGPFRIHVVAERSGVPAATLRAWERRYGVPTPERTASAYRLYSLQDLEQVRVMRALCDAGLSAAEAARQVTLARVPELERPSLPEDVYVAAKQRILQAAEKLDADRLDAELMRLGYAGDAASLYERVVTPLLVDVGAAWASGELSVGQEHFLSQRIELMLRNSLSMMRSSDGPTALLACVAGEHHVLGLLGAALRFASWGARVVLLGADTPPAAVGDAIQRCAPRLVGLAASRVPERAKSLLSRYAKVIGDRPWVLGGDAAPELAATVLALGGRVALSSGDSSWQHELRELLYDGVDPRAHRARSMGK